MKLINKYAYIDSKFGPCVYVCVCVYKYSKQIFLSNLSIIVEVLYFMSYHVNFIVFQITIIILVMIPATYFKKSWDDKALTTL